MDHAPQPATPLKPAALPYHDALALALDALPVRGARPTPLADALHGRLAEDLHADRDQPPFDRAQMDGYALRHADLAVALGEARPLPVSGSIPAGAAPGGPLAHNTCVAIATGAPLPCEADTVVQHELTDRGNPVTFTAIVPKGHAVHPRGADAKVGDVVLRAGTRLAARHLTIAATVGAVTPQVIPAARVAILTSGDEIVPPESTPATHQVRNGNATLLGTLLPLMGARLGTVAHLIDESAPTTDAVRTALAEHDLVVTVGGISAGDRDRFVTAIDDLELRTVVRRVRLRPGGPLTIAIDATHGSVLLGLPGNPVSALVCAHLFAWPLLRAMNGEPHELPWRPATLGAPARTSGDRQSFRPARLATDGTVDVPQWAGSGDLMHTADTDGIVELPLNDGQAAPGSPVRFLPWVEAAGAGGM